MKRAFIQLMTAALVCLLCVSCGGGGGGGGGGPAPSGGTGGGETPVNPGQPPVANAGGAATYSGGEIAMLDGTGSTDPDGDPLRYTWTQTGGAHIVQLDSRHAARPVFEVPNADDVLTFSLTVNDGYDTSAAAVVAVTTVAYAGAKTAPLSKSPFRGDYAFSGAGQDLVIANNHVFLPAGFNGLQVVDASDPVNLTQDGIMTFEDAYDVTLIGNYIYHTSYDSVFDTARIWITDVSNPAAPALYAMVAMFDSPASARITSAGSVLYAAGGDDATTPSLRVYEVGDPANPVSTTSFKISLPLPEAPQDVEVAGNYAYLADGASGLRIVDISNATAATPTISEAGSFDTAGNAVNVAVAGSYAYLADGMNGLVILDVSNPALPSPAATLPAPSGSLYGTASVDVSGNRLYVANDFDVYVYDVSTPPTPNLLGQYRAGNLIRKVRANGAYLYVTDSQGLRTIPISTVSLPRGVALYTAPAEIRKMTVYGDLGFVQMDHRIDILDLRDVAAPALLSSYPSSEYLSDMEVIDNFVYLAQGTNQLSLLQFRDPSAASIAKTVPAGAGIQKIVTDDAYAYVYRNTFPNADIVIYDVVDPASPVARGVLASPYNDANWLRSMAVRGNQLFLTELNTSGTFRVADVNNPSAPTLIGNGLGPVDLYGIAFRGDAVLTIGNNTGVKVLDVSIPASPVYSGTGYPQQGYSLAVAGNRAYANSDFVGGGVKVLDAEDPLALSLAGELAPAGGADHPVVTGGTLYSFYEDLELHRHEREPTLAERYVTASSGATVTYSVGWEDEAGGDDHAVQCRVTGGSCSVDTLDQAADRATVSWTLPAAAGDHEITIAVGNGHYFSTTKDRIQVQ